MSNNWIDFLSHSGAVFDAHKNITFEPKTNAITGDLYLTDLTWLGLIQVSGEDRKTFLQGQLTNDVNAVSSSLSHLSGLCTPKGRMRALFSIFSRQDSLYLQMPLPLVEDIIKRLRMFVLMSKVELSDASDTLVRIGVYGRKAEKHLNEAGLNLPKELNMVSETEQIQLIRLAGEQPRFQVIGTYEQIRALWDKLKPKAALLSTNQWRLLDIQAAVPNVFPQTNEMFIPQMLNLQALNGISFKKGCYTGQEVVARMQYLGKLKRHMYIAHCDTDKLPEPGAELHSQTAKSGQGTGNIVDAQHSPGGGIDLLAVITSEAANNNDIYLDEAFAIPLNLKALPYELNLE
jgi:folate-binding protein YgfZ